MFYNIISNLVGSQLFQTMIAGLSIFILSQFFLELYLKPRVELKKLRALLSEKLLTYQSKITNGKLSTEQIQEIRDISARLLSTAWLVYFRDSKKKIFLEISQNVNGVVSSSQSKRISDIEFSIKCLNALKKHKFLKVTFE